MIFVSPFHPALRLINRPLEKQNGAVNAYIHMYTYACVISRLFSWFFYQPFNLVLRLIDNPLKKQKSAENVYIYVYIISTLFVDFPITRLIRLCG